MISNKHFAFVQLLKFKRTRNNKIFQSFVNKILADFDVIIYAYNQIL
ncbi:hypothetical protein MtrunA17_Chr7g0253581 [Medicago truncatula]|uniref:Uncharacterized protein n=1 Tax=Medicago truncatula TaxID=3880 RepID=A0A396H4R1_MEDTR|nr:hypothetical protein MtrunA17_Chr7g0253581 [Medicago truncatula]